MIHLRSTNCTPLFRSILQILVEPTPHGIVTYNLFVIIQHPNGIHVYPIGSVEESEEEWKEPAWKAIDSYRSVARPLGRCRSWWPRRLTHEHPCVFLQIPNYLSSFLYLQLFIRNSLSNQSADFFSFKLSFISSGVKRLLLIESQRTIESISE